jgi:tetratricopeptide (TPR) repeat protein
MLAGRSFEDLGALGQMLLKEGAPVGTAMVYEKMAEMRPDNADVHGMLGRLYLKADKHAAAISAMERARSLSPGPARTHDLAEAHDLYGVFLASNGDPAQAMHHFTESMRLDPGYSKVRGDYGVLLGGMGKEMEAIRELEEAIRLDPQNADAHDNFGVILGRRGQVERAVGHFEKAAAIQPDNWLFREHLAYAYFYVKKYDRTWAEVRRFQMAGKNLNPQFLQALKAAMPEPPRREGS